MVYIGLYVLLKLFIFGKTLFVKENIGVTFQYLNFQLLVVVDGACLTGFKV